LTRSDTNSRFITTGAVVLVVALGIAWVVYAHRSKPLLVIGDSLSLDAKDDLIALGEAAGYDVNVDAFFGVRLEDRMPLIEQQRDRRSGPLVIELGTNDVRHGDPPEVIDGLIDEAIGVLVDVPCVVFVNIGMLTSEGEVAAAVNEHLKASAAQHPSMHVYDWAAEFAQHPDWSVDGIHLQPPFRRLYAQGIINTVKASC
jgi:hypothetical protein